MDRDVLSFILARVKARLQLRLFISNIDSGFDLEYRTCKVIFEVSSVVTKSRLGAEIHYEKERAILVRRELRFWLFARRLAKFEVRIESAIADEPRQQ